MKIVITWEENGYEARYYDEIEEEIGSSLVCDNSPRRFWEKLNNIGIIITIAEFKKMISNLSFAPFVILHGDDRPGAKFEIERI
jgi:hypothetical protein